ncbi:MAG: L,D-transpeptidase [Paracoccaceae bacterium]
MIRRLLICALVMLGPLGLGLIAPAMASADGGALLRDAVAGERIILAQARNVKSVPRSHGPTTREVIAYPSNEKPGTILISNGKRELLVVLPGGKAARYDISVGRDGFTWTGTTYVGRKAKWPEWRPPAEMRKRDPSLPDMVPSGPYNPLGARALYLYSKGGDTLYRIHGTNNAPSIGNFETSGCFRLTNADVMELFENVPVGTKVIVKE